MSAPHDWMPSTLGHGETMCRRCFATNREAAVLGMVTCDVPPPPPKPANENPSPERVWTQDEIDEQMFVDDEDGDDGSDCGRWNNGHLTSQCRKAGSEECDWECPIGQRAHPLTRGGAR